MAVCQNCSATNDAGRATCVRCGMRLDLAPDEDGLSALRRLTTFSEPSAGSKGAVGVSAEEATPDWLELLLAKYGEDIPAFAGAKSLPADVGPAPEQSPKGTVPIVQEKAAPDGKQVPPADEAEENLDWLTELEKLKAAPAAPPPAPKPIERAPSAPGVSEESPDWLAELRAARVEAAVAPTPESPTPQASEQLLGEMPPAVGGEEGASDWLTSLRKHTTEAVEPSAGPTIMPEAAEPPPPADKPEELPDWLRELGLVQSPAEETTPSPLAGGLGELSQPATLFPEEHPVSGKEGEEGAIPDWLSRLVAVTATEPTREERSEPPPAEAAPFAPEVRSAAWLPRMTAEEVEAVSTTGGPSSDEIPDWLHEMEMAQSTQGVAPPERAAVPQASTPSVAAEATPPEPERQSPPWLAELQSMVEHSPQAEPPTVRDEDLPQPSGAPQSQDSGSPLFPQGGGGEVPDWLRELRSQPPEPAHRVPPAAPVAQDLSPAAPAAQDLSPAEIPGWLARLRPSEETGRPGLEPAVAEESAASSGTGHPTAEDEAIASLRARLGVPQVPDVEGATLFREIATEQPESPPLPDKRSAMRGLAGAVIWVLIFLAIILGIAIVLLAVLGRVEDMLGGSAFHRFLESPAAMGLVMSVQNFRERVTTLPPGAVVVMGTDYTPATGAEMEPIAQAILRDLLDHQARVVTVSLRPEGAAMAQRLLDRLNNDYPYGERTLNLGYLPGETAGVRSLTLLRDLPVFSPQAIYPTHAGATLADSPAWRDVEGLDDVALVVEVADSAQPVRWWVEQASPMPLAERPMLAAVGASALPVVRPYYSPDRPGPGRLQGLISGVTAAATYEIFLGQPGRAVRSVAAQSVVHLGLVAVALAGTIAGFRSDVTTDRHR